MGKTCEICGKPSGFFPLCTKCNKLKDDGKVVKCETCNKWHYLDKPCDCKPISKESTIVDKKEKKCIVCGKNAPNGPLCIDCFKEKERVKGDFVQNRAKLEITEHYYNQKNALYKVKNEEYIDNGILRLIAISEELSVFHNDNSLKERVSSDIKKLQEIKSQSENEQLKSDLPFVKKSFDDEDYRKQWTAEHQCDDGHYVRSISEKTIDDWLYNNGYVHAYEKSVFMESDPNAIVLSDFYLPSGNVYIEFWGLNDDQKYLERKEKKIKMYTDNHLQLISLEEKDVKRLNDIMQRKIYEFTKK